MPDSIHIAAVGDIMPGEYAALGFGVLAQARRHGWDRVFAGLDAALRQSDFIIGNLEAALSQHGRRRMNYDSVIFRGEPSAAPALRSAGFRALCVANNHTLQHGREAFLDTARLLREAGIAPVGTRGKGPGSELEVVEAHGKRVGLLGYSLWPSEQHEEQNDVFPMLRGRESLIVDQIREHAPRVDHLIVCIHWGYEFVHQPSEEQIALGRAMIEAGARCVLGHHPHVLQGVERWKDGVIAYSLGNFVFDMDLPACRESAILEIELLPGRVGGHRWRPMRLDAEFRPVPADHEAISASLRDYDARVVDPVFARERTRARCEELSAQGKIEAQAWQNRYFIANAYRYPWRFLWTKAYRKMKNIVLRRYRASQYRRDIHHNAGQEKV